MTIGVIGPEDLVTLVVEAGRAPGKAKLVPCPYPREDATVEVMDRHCDGVDAFLFTGVVPYMIAADAGVLSRPAMFVSYSGATLLSALIELQRLGHDVSALSIDTLSRSQVLETLAEAKLPTDRVQVLEYRAGLSSQAIVAFHRRARREGHSTVAITCLGSAYQVLQRELQITRLVPSKQSIRDALRELMLITDSRRGMDAQVAIGLVKLSGPDPALGKELVSVAGSLGTHPDGGYLVITTRGLLEQATAQFTHFPLLRRLSNRHEMVHMGFGLGRTAAEAESRARHALSRTEAVGPVAAVITLSEDADIVIQVQDASSGAASDGRSDPALLAWRVGLSKETLGALRSLTPKDESLGLTTAEVAEHLHVQERTARRVLKRLERAGLAEPVATQIKGAGRPPIVYRLMI